MTYRFALVVAAALPAAVTAAAASAQVIAVKTAPIADGGQFAFLPSANLGMGGVSIAMADSMLDPFVNPAKGARSSGTRIFGAPTFFSVTRKAGGGLTLPLGASMSNGAWFSQFVLAMQDVDRAGENGGVAVPLAATADARLTSTAAPPEDDRDRSRQNRYVHGMLWRRLGHGVSLASSASWWRINALDGVELYYPTSQGVRQHGEALDLRLGIVQDLGRGHTLEAVAVHNRFAVNHDVSFTDPFWDPSQRTFVFRQRVEPNADRTDTWGLHLAYMRPLSDSTWRVGAVVTGNRIRQPRMPGYELPQVQADAGRSSAFDVGAGVSRSTGPFTMGFDAIYEPIWSKSWVRAGEATTARDGSAIDAGTNLLDNRFRFHNGIARLGFSYAMPLSEGQVFTFETGGQVRAIRYRLEQSDAVQQTESASTQHWNEWTRSWGLALRVAGATVQYRGYLTTGASRPGFDDNGNVFAVIDDVAAPRPGFFGGGPFGLQFGKVRTTTHQISFSVPIR